MASECGEWLWLPNVKRSIIYQNNKKSCEEIQVDFYICCLGSSHWVVLLLWLRKYGRPVGSSRRSANTLNCSLCYMTKLDTNDNPQILITSNNEITRYIFVSVFCWFAHTGWWRGVVVNALVVINEVTLHWARLVLGWVTICGWVNHLGM